MSRSAIGFLALALSPELVFASGCLCGSTSEAKQEGVDVRIGYANEPPFGYFDFNAVDRSGAEGDTDWIKGEAPVIIERFLDHKGVPHVNRKFVKGTFGMLIGGLNGGRIDIIAAGMYITPDRCKHVNFSNPTYMTYDGFLVERGNPHGLRSYGDVKSSDDDDVELRIGMLLGSVEADDAKAAGVSDDKIFEFRDIHFALDALRAGKIDVFAGPKPTLRFLARQVGGELDVVPIHFESVALRLKEMDFEVKHYEELRDLGGDLRVGALFCSAEAQELKATLRKDQLHLAPRLDVDEGAQADALIESMLRGTIDVVILDREHEAKVQERLKERARVGKEAPELARSVLKSSNTVAHYGGFAFRTRDNELRQEFDDWLACYLGTGGREPEASTEGRCERRRSQEETEEMKAKGFLIPDRTAEELCGCGSEGGEFGVSGG